MARVRVSPLLTQHRFECVATHGIPQHRVFTKEAGRGVSTLGWFYGFKLHLIVNTDGELLAAEMTPGNTNDRKPVLEVDARSFWQTLCR